MVKNLRRLTCKFDIDQSERNSSQVDARPGQTESLAGRPKFSTCVYLGVRLPRVYKRALGFLFVYYVTD